MSPSIQKQCTVCSQGGTVWGGEFHLHPVLACLGQQEGLAGLCPFAPLEERIELFGISPTQLQ